MSITPQQLYSKVTASCYQVTSSSALHACTKSTFSLIYQIYSERHFLIKTLPIMQALFLMLIYSLIIC